MMLLDGKIVADKFKDVAKNEIKQRGLVNKIRLDVIQIGNDMASNTYIKNKRQACEYVGINMVVHNLDSDVEQEYIEALIQHLSVNNSVNGILLQLPIPEHLDEEYLISCINPYKDVDGFTAYNQGLLARGYDLGLFPCTPLGIIGILSSYDVDIEGKNCVVVGRSNDVGMPMAMMLTHNNGTVTVCHSHTKNLKDICQSADILVCTIGKPKFFTRDYMKTGAVVIDVGINRDESNKLCGDVDFDDVKDIVGAITPVPGGVGQMTVAALIHNCLTAWDIQNDGDIYD